MSRFIRVLPPPSRILLYLILILIVSYILVIQYYFYWENKNKLLPEKTQGDGGRTSRQYPRALIQPNVYSSPIIQRQGCIITVVFMDPALDSAAFASLESVAAYVQPTDRTCILIQTALCPFTQDQDTDTQSQEVAYKRLTKFIFTKAGPLLQSRIRQGQVRVTILNHTRYDLYSCDYFYSPSNPWLNYYYWNDYFIDHDNEYKGEFVAGQDADLVLTIQKDAVLCHSLDAWAWKQFSFVGAPWPPSLEWWSCTQLVANWITWHSQTNSSVPPYPSETDFCTEINIGPLGNGGLSLRSRFWMQRAIEYCPDTKLSGLFLNHTITCSTFKTGNEDIYFATILRGMVQNNFKIHDKPSSVPPLKLPSMVEAAYFSSESLWLKDVIEHYNVKHEDILGMVQKLEWWDGKYSNKGNTIVTPTTAEDGRDRFHRLKALEGASLGKKPFVPIGLHKFWKYDNKGLLYETESYEHLLRECPHLKEILPNATQQS